TSLSLNVQLDGSDEPAVRIDQFEGADDGNRLACERGRVDLGQDLLLHLLVQRRPSVLVIDLIDKLAERDRARGVAQIGSVDRRPSLHAYEQRARNVRDL